MYYVDIFYTHFNTPLPLHIYQSYLHTLPPHYQQRIQRYRRWQDQQATLFSQLLLRQVLVKKGYTSDCLAQLHYEKQGRPFIDKTIDFNISHAGEYVVCAITATGRVGIDIEPIRPIEIADFYSTMTPEQWSTLITSQNPYHQFFDNWTLKESVIKADGRGLWIPLETIHITAQQAQVEDKIWFIKKIDNIDAQYACHLATDQLPDAIRLYPITFSEPEALI